MTKVIKFPITLEQRNQRIEEFVIEREFQYVQAMVELEDFIDRALHMVDKGFVIEPEDMEIISTLLLKLRYLEKKYNEQQHN